MDTELRCLLNVDGRTFTDEIEAVAPVLGNLSNDERLAYRNANAGAIAESDAARCLVVSGPGSGKSFLFLDRIRYWLSQAGTPEIYVSSFVRKLVGDLQADIETKIAKESQPRVTATTLHTLARSLIERNKGTADLHLASHVSVMGSWERIVWEDVLAFHSDVDKDEYSLRAHQEQMYDDALLGSGEWPNVRVTFDALRTFYNAVGFADMIVTARIAVEENPDLVTQTHWIFDEHQDFNAAEDHLVEAVTVGATAVLLAGDDDQALYQQLKHSHPEIIKRYYDDPGFVKAMLPYCSRCSYYVCLAASAFINRHREEGGIPKIYLPLCQNPDATKVQVIAAATPSSAVDYVADFIETHREQLEAHRDAMQSGEETDAYLMILSPDRKLGYYKMKGADDELHGLIAEWADPAVDHSPDYWTVATYYSTTHNTSDNFAVRKVLAYEGVSVADVHKLIAQALDEGIDLRDISSSDVTAALERCAELAAILELGELTPEDKAARCADLIAVADIGRLAEEFAADPISRSTDEGNDAIEPGANGSAVQLHTIVGAKGLSAKHVMVLGCDNANLARTTPLAFYVALSRARESLHIITAAKARGATETHGFVLDLPEDCCEYWTHTKTSGRESLAGKAAFRRKLAMWANAARKSRPR